MKRTQAESDGERPHPTLVLEELDALLYAVQQGAWGRNMIPIAGIISRELGDGRHEVLGVGHNRLREGIPGIHGETAALMHMGRIPGGYRDLTATSTLTPCEFCQNCLIRQLGIKKIRILNGSQDYYPDLEAYRASGIDPRLERHAGIELLFADWVRDSKNEILWKRDIGISSGCRGRPYTPARSDAWQPYVDQARRLAEAGMKAGEAPIGAIIVDEWGEVAGSGFPGICIDNDPSKTAAIAAWRSCGSRDDWGRHTLVLSCGPDPIVYSMFKTFRFGQLVVGSSAVYSGELVAIAQLKHPIDDQTPVAVHLLQDSTCDLALLRWLDLVPREVQCEYFGAEWQR